MRPILASFSLAAMLTLAGGAAYAQPTDDDIADSYSYHHTEIFTGPDAARMVRPIAGTPVMAHDIPTIDEAPEGHARADVSFLTGGVGDEERAAIEASKGEYNLHVTNARADGAFVGDTLITIHQKTGVKDEMLSVEAGPLLYVQLPPGDYVLDANHNDELKQQSFSVGSKKHRTANITLRWARPVVHSGE